MDSATAALCGSFLGISGTLLSLVVQDRLSKRQQQTQMKLAALDRRLQAHQEAYALWYKLISTSKSDETYTEFKNKCYDWWYDNCLYLHEDVRDCFMECLVCSADPESQSDEHTVLQLYFNLPRLIEKAVGLPPINDVVLAQFKRRRHK